MFFKQKQIANHQDFLIVKVTIWQSLKYKNQTMALNKSK